METFIEKIMDSTLTILWFVIVSAILLSPIVFIALGIIYIGASVIVAGIIGLIVLAILATV